MAAEDFFVLDQTPSRSGSDTAWDSLGVVFVTGTVSRSNLGPVATLPVSGSSDALALSLSCLVGFGAQWQPLHCMGG